MRLLLGRDVGVAGPALRLDPLREQLIELGFKPVEESKHMSDVVKTANSVSECVAPVEDVPEDNNGQSTQGANADMLKISHGLGVTYRLAWWLSRLYSRLKVLQLLHTRRTSCNSMRLPKQQS
jgi:hypothetical protein